MVIPRRYIVAGVWDAARGLSVIRSLSRFRKGDGNDKPAQFEKRAINGGKKFLLISGWLVNVNTNTFVIKDTKL